MTVITTQDMFDEWQKTGTGLGLPADAAVSDGSSSAGTIALLKGLQVILGAVAASPTANTIGDRLKTLSTLIGEVQASPTANTMLARLKTLEGYCDGLETALGTTSDAAATGDGSLIAIVKQLRAILTDVWSDTNNAINVSLTGRNVAEEALFDAVAIADTTSRLSGILGKGDWVFLVKSTLDQPVTLSIIFYGENGVFNVTPSDNAPNYTLAAGADDIITGEDWPALKYTVPNSKIKIVMGTAPTSGSISIYAFGGGA